MTFDALRRRPGPVPRGAGSGLSRWLSAPPVGMALPMLPMLMALCLAACSPVLDWRQVRPEGWHLAAAMPCRPDAQQRQVMLAGAQAPLGLWVCSTGGFTFALASVDAAEPARVGPILQALLAAAQANVQGRVKARLPAAVPGMTPHPDAQQVQLDGAMPDGRAVGAQVLVFVHGLRVFQATVLGPDLGPAQTAPFFEAIEIAQ